MCPNEPYQPQHVWLLQSSKIIIDFYLPGVSQVIGKPSCIVSECIAIKQSDDLFNLKKTILLQKWQNLMVIMHNKFHKQQDLKIPDWYPIVHFPFRYHLGQYHSPDLNVNNTKLNPYAKHIIQHCWFCALEDIR